MHVDVMDGHFVPNITLGAVLVAAIRPFVTTLMDVHLMIAPVDPYLEAFVTAGADIVTIHAEAGPHLDRSLARIRDLGARAGVSLTPSTPPEATPHAQVADPRQEEVEVRPCLRMDRDDVRPGVDEGLEDTSRPARSSGARRAAASSTRPDRLHHQRAE